ncbi:hypothetical protein HUK65_18110 [Rhodobacteraceae bacterium 2376]|uniref:Uncharacterized protein n=1 Tax=Rhabdonatronobacter sediminivivens TaxID=2743469 RepID=A0A7Z0I2R4_9RHOB|nr:hypothetical protein [Rhabdonatronobacter sediminivivens]NYS26874.1 hypothetical protein [Rhabdonatronobacter sediminivivens]
MSTHILSTFTTPTTCATLDRMHHQGDTEAALDAADGELSTGRALFYFPVSISEAAKPLQRKDESRRR